MGSRSMSSIRKAFAAFALVAFALVCALLPAGRAFADGYSITVEDAAEGEYYLYQIFDGTFTTDDEGNIVMGEAVVNDDVEDVVVSVLADQGVTVEGYSYGEGGTYAGEDESYTDVARANNLMDAIAALEDEQAFADALAEALLADSSIAALSSQTNAADSSTVTFSDLATGYYLVVEYPAEGANAGVGAILVPLSESTTVRTKTEVPTPTKEVGEVAEDGTVSWGDTADAEVLEAVPYRITGTLPSSWAYQKTYYYCIYDVSDEGILIDTDTIVVTLLDEEGEALADLTDYATITYEDNTLMVCFDDLVAAVAEAGATATADCTVQVTYEASLTLEVLEAGADGVKVNGTYIVYGPDHETSVEDSASLLTWALELVKTGEDTDEALEGAVFTIQDASGSYVAADGSLTDEAVEFTTGADGTISVSGLDSGTYTVTETEAPEGYDAIDAFTVTITAGLDDEVTLSATADSSAVSAIEADAQSGTITLDVVDGLTPFGGSSSGSSSGLWESLVQTGDSPWALVVAALLVVGVVAVVVGLRLRRRSSGSNE